MDLWTMIVLIVLIGVGGGIVSDYMKTQRVKAKAGELSDGDTADLHAELDALRERVAVLEKIVTEERFDLGREIDKLERTA